jgi:malate synthase
MSEVPASVERARDELREDHERLHAVLARLRVTPDRRALAALLHELPQLLAEHFHREERPGGLYDTIGLCLSEARGEIGQLIDDHFRLATIGRDLAERALAPGVSTLALQAEAIRVADYLAEHERRERELVEATLKRA